MSRKIIASSMIILDGVMQAAGGPEEDTTGDFKYGGWTAPYLDEAYGKVMEKQLWLTPQLAGIVRRKSKVETDRRNEKRNCQKNIQNMRTLICYHR